DRHPGIRDSSINTDENQPLPGAPNRSLHQLTVKTRQCPLTAGRKVSLRQFQSPGHLMIGAVAVSYLLHPLHIRDLLPSGASRQIAKDERIVGSGSLLRKLSKQDTLKATHPRLVHRT